MAVAAVTETTSFARIDATAIRGFMIKNPRSNGIRPVEKPSGDRRYQPSHNASSIIAGYKARAERPPGTGRMRSNAACTSPKAINMSIASWAMG